MPLPALAAVAGLAVAAHLRRRGSASKLSEENKKRIVEPVKQGLVSKARALAVELGLDTLDLSGANLQRANLIGANLSNANLTGASLTDAILTGANLSGANLTGADLSDARLYYTDLTGADLTGAKLTRASIEGAIGINIGPTRTFVGIPFGYIEAKSPFVQGRTTLRRTE